MYARKNGGRFHVNPEPDAIRKLADEGYEILDDDLQPVADPVAEAERQREANGVTGTIEDFIKYCSDNHISFI